MTNELPHMIPKNRYTIMIIPVIMAQAMKIIMASIDPSKILKGQSTSSTILHINIRLILLMSSLDELLRAPLPRSSGNGVMTAL